MQYYHYGLLAITLGLGLAIVFFILTFKYDTTTHYPVPMKDVIVTHTATQSGVPCYDGKIKCP